MPTPYLAYKFGQATALRGKPAFDEHLKTWRAWNLRIFVLQTVPDPGEEALFIAGDAMQDREDRMLAELRRFSSLRRMCYYLKGEIAVLTDMAEEEGAKPR